MLTRKKRATSLADKYTDMTMTGVLITKRAS